MGYLLVSRDERLAARLRDAMPDRAQLHVAADVPAALRSWPSVVFAGIAIDGGLPDTEFEGAVRAWESGLVEAGVAVAVEPWEGAMPASVTLVEREVGRIWEALLPPAALVLDPHLARLSGADGEIALTPSELTIVACLVAAPGGVTGEELRSELGYASGTTGVSRTHVANIRRKCRKAGLGEVIERVGPRYFAPVVRLGEPSWQASGKAGRRMPIR
ncbi:MAG: hypothetical protein O6913_08440 [Chloroflexi bacterium]|nr:hypothetical protein [Chloroflexota bacterium]MCZ6706764.1 hypothetical protein [Chloroflexota bacterium]